MPIKAKFTFEGKYQNAFRCSDLRRLTKSMAEMRRVFAAERQMCVRYGSPLLVSRERMMQR